ncbi:MAG: hypothetical protein J7513_17770 [Solirubrobacteraceae bacterium]|nr:hypothetical protein [Solirubrobacteraceae bacterium]
MAATRTFTSDDERVAFAAQLGWDVRAHDADEQAAADHFSRETLARGGYEEQLEGVDQALLDEVRDAVLRRQRQSAAPGS